MFETGDIVLCVNNTGIPSRITQLKKGKMYEVVGIREWPKGIGLTIRGIKQKRRIVDSKGRFICITNPPYCASRFEKVQIDISELLTETEVSHG